MSVRALVIREREKLIGSRDGLFYIDEKNHRFKSFKIPQLRSNMIFCCLFYQGEYYIGTYGGGMYILNPQTLMIRDFESDGKMPFSKGHIFCIKQDYDNNLWIGTSMGIFAIRTVRGLRIILVPILNFRMEMFMKSILILRKKDGSVRRMGCAYGILLRRH